MASWKEWLKVHAESKRETSNMTSKMTSNMRSAMANAGTGEGVHKWREVEFTEGHGGWQDALVTQVGQ